MREIKFRAWGGSSMFYSHNNTINSSIEQLSWFFSKLRPEANVMQFTGLTDKNGKEIYEMDVVEFIANYSSKPCGYMKGLVVFDENQWMLKNKNGLYSISEETDEFYCKSEVIGNTHETPNLLI